MLSHFLTVALSISALSGGVIPAPFLALLMLRAGSAPGRPPSLLRTPVRAVDVAPVAARTNLDLNMASSAVVKPVTGLDGRSWPSSFWPPSPPCATAHLGYRFGDTCLGDPARAGTPNTGPPLDGPHHRRRFHRSVRFSVVRLDAFDTKYARFSRTVHNTVSHCSTKPSSPDEYRLP